MRAYGTRVHPPRGSEIPARVSLCLLLFVGLVCAASAEEKAGSADSGKAGDADKPLFFLQFSDPQLGMFANNRDFEQETANLEFAIATANRLKPAFVVITGDLTNKSGDAAQTAEYQRIVKKLDSAIHLYNVPGNHDVGNKPSPQAIAAYVERYGPDHYRFREGDLVGLVLNSALIHTPDAAPAQYREQDEWLKAELGKAKDEGVRHVVVFQHHPPFLKTPDEPDQYFNLPLVRRGPYLDLLRQNGVSHVFCGHLHQDKVARDGALEVVVTGALGNPLGGTRSGLQIAVVREGRIAHRYYDLGELPNKIDPATWPDGELIRGKP